MPYVDNNTMKLLNESGDWHTPSLFVNPLKPATATPNTALKQVSIYFDGGCNPNPGLKYGSFEVVAEGQTVAGKNRTPFGHGTNNEAEFNALNLALDETMVWLLKNGKDPREHSLVIETDSTIVRNRLLVKNVILKKYPRSQQMFALASTCLGIMRKFGNYDVVWKGRESNVKRFGH